MWIFQLFVFVYDGHDHWLNWSMNGILLSCLYTLGCIHMRLFCVFIKSLYNVVVHTITYGLHDMNDNTGQTNNVLHIK